MPPTTPFPFTLTQLQYALSVDEHRHFGRAARACHISQPTLSMQIQKLEEDLGILLFDRTKQPVLPTPEGETFLLEARGVVRAASSLGSREAASGVVSGELRLGVIPSLSPYLVPLFLKHFLSRYPQVQLRLKELRTDEITAALEEDRIDAGLLATPLPEHQLLTRPIFYEPFAIFASRGHPLLAHKDPQPLLGRAPPSDLWLLTGGHCFKEQVLAVCSLRGQDRGAMPNLEFQAGSLEVLIRLIRSGTGYTLLPELAVQTLSSTERRDQVRHFTRRIPSREISLVTHRAFHKNRILQALQDSIEVCLPDSLPRKRPATFQVVGITEAVLGPGAIKPVPTQQ